MKKLTFSLLLSSLLLSSGIASAADDVSHPKLEYKPFSVLVNGMEVYSNVNHMYQSRAYISVDVFARMFDKSYTLAPDHRSISFNGKTIGNIRMMNGQPTAWVRDLSTAVDATMVSWNQKKQEIQVLILPMNAIPLDPPKVPVVGEQWANPLELPFGPIYGLHNGKLIYLEYMIPQKDFVEGKNYVNLKAMKGLPSPSVVYTDMELKSEGFEAPYYDFHAYFISKEEQRQIGNQYVELKNAQGERMGFVSFTPFGNRVLLRVSATGLTPGKHGFHIHEHPITGNDFTTAGGHFNPNGKQHGQNNLEGSHAGDLTNLIANDKGMIDQVIVLNNVSLDTLKGKSLIIHSGEDDLKTDPSGNSGDRVVGGNIAQ